MFDAETLRVCVTRDKLVNALCIIIDLYATDLSRYFCGTVGIAGTKQI